MSQIPANKLLTLSSLLNAGEILLRQQAFGIDDWLDRDRTGHAAADTLALLGKEALVIGLLLIDSFHHILSFIIVAVKLDSLRRSMHTETLHRLSQHGSIAFVAKSW